MKQYKSDIDEKISKYSLDKEDDLYELRSDLVDAVTILRRIAYDAEFAEKYAIEKLDEIENRIDVIDATKESKQNTIN
jgi:hypothetical protein